MPNHFEIVGWDLPTCVAAGEKAMAIAGSLSAGVAAFSFEAHFQDLEGTSELATAIPNGRYSQYCWGKVENGRSLKDFDYRNVLNARLYFGGISLSIEYGQSGFLPPYDWNGTLSPFTLIRFTERHGVPLSSESRDPSPVTIRKLSNLAARCFSANDFQVETLTEWLHEGRNHHYMLKVPVGDAMGFLAEICAEFRLGSATGTFEMCGSPADLERVVSRKTFRSSGFPAVAPNLNVRKTPFAIEPNSFFVPLPNVTNSELCTVARLRDSMRERIIHSSLTARYISWKLADNAFSPRVHGNYLFVSQQKAGYAIFVGFERYEDKDPTVQKFTSFAVPTLEQMGGRLKKVGGPR